MIRYALVCSTGHEFEAWFGNSKAFDAQQRRGDVVCPVCGATDVSKALMAPAVSTTRKKDKKEGRPEPMPVAANVSEPPEAAAMLRKLRKHLTDNAVYVGGKFAEEARRIHFNEVEKRAIYGEATPQEAHALIEDEVEFHPLPRLPEDQN